MKNIKRTTTIATFTILAAACGAEDSMQVGSRFLASADVDASGGGFDVDGQGSALDGLRLEVPAGAVDAEVRLGVTPSDSLPVEEDIEWVGPAADFEPDGQRFAVPVRITMPLSESLGEREPVIRVLSADGTEELLEGAQVQVMEGFVSFEIDHFTRFQPGGRQRPSGCTSDADCPQGDVCGQGGTCVTPPPPPECRTDADCARGETCSARQTCEPAPSGCAVDADCDTDEVCVRAGAARGMCVVGDCTEDADCAQGEECSPNYSCVPAPECRADADCPPGEVCSAGGMCGPPGPQCRTDQDCIRQQLGRVCAQGRCV